MALVIVARGVALNIFGKAASSGSLAMRLMRLKKAIVLIMNNIQRYPAETHVDLASKVRTAVAVGDRGHELYPFTQQDRSPEGWQVQTFLHLVRPSFAAELLLARSEAALGAPDTAVVRH